MKVRQIEIERVENGWVVTDIIDRGPAACNLRAHKVAESTESLVDIVRLWAESVRENEEQENR
jgi:hypothetical protein